MVNIQKRADERVDTVDQPVEPTSSGWLKAAGLAVAVGLAVVSAFYEAGWCSSYVFSVRFPISIILVLVCNPALVWFAEQVTGKRSSGVAPAVAWCCVWLATLTQTTEGDLIVLSNNWVGIATTLVGPLAFATALYSFILIPPRDRQDGVLLKKPAGRVD